ncbi:N-acetylmuramoyl-L-alanine amidase [Streptomyces sp. SLBN-118]|uniref:N-acetylmuramoyl-L-alanine amidase n=1 Tax=Streptomyces sp. SLBN-118 TaxID=2768454 RepID=UPI00116A7CC9|nr:N-acetylmuramoyl-L-alanine amidase [Streptomyces sp. SLBN-118]TQK44187.1 N-acetylmuramoyl-L-alanine amidase [Streptomyces sp. SLBN-118]
MSYDENQPSARPRRSGRGNLIIAIAALVPTALAGWLVWQTMSGPEENEPPKALPLPSTPTTAGKPGGPTATAPSPGTSPSTSPSKPSGGKNGATGPLSGKVVVVDPGHNPGNFQHTSEINKLVDIGTNRKECDTTGTATVDGYTEAEFTRDVSQRLRRLLEKQGATVQFTHDNDRAFGPCVDERARIGNKAKADAVVSVHADGASVGDRGFHVILPALVKAGAADTTNIVGPSRELGTRIAGRFVRATGSAPSNYIGDGTGLDVRKDLGGLNLSTVPKVFIECGNMRDPKDAALLKDSEWRQLAAQGMADGIAGYLQG